jgi:hypothetical protein
MAIAAAPYFHPRLASIDSTVRTEVNVSQLTEEQRRQRARQAILEAFAERPMKLIEGEVIDLDRGKPLFGNDSDIGNQRSPVKIGATPGSRMGESMGSASTANANPLEQEDKNR